MIANSLLRKLMFVLKNTSMKVREYFELPLRIEEIDVSKKIVILRSRCVRATLQLTIAEAVTDLFIIENLPPIQASWLGYYAGQLYDDIGNEKRNILFGGKVGEFKLHFKKGRYKMVSQSRGGAVEYIDTVTGIICENWPLNIARNRKIISGFDPSQACYIGVLAGVETNKLSIRQDVGKQAQMMLRVVK